MRIVRCTGARFDEDCKKLASAINEIAPDVVIGVRTGGAVVLDQMIYLDALHSTTFVYARAARSLTKSKNELRKSSILDRLPRSLLKLARVAEHHYRERKFYLTNRRVTARNVSFDSVGANQTALLASARKVVIVDDAIDSGSTIVALMQVLSEINPESKIFSVCMTQTYSKPLVTPDVALYYRQLLIFPWSLDAKE